MIDTPLESYRFHGTGKEEEDIANRIFVDRVDERDNLKLTPAGTTHDIDLIKGVLATHLRLLVHLMLKIDKHGTRQQLTCLHIRIFNCK